MSKQGWYTKETGSTPEVVVGKQGSIPLMFSIAFQSYATQKFYNAHEIVIEIPCRKKPAWGRIKFHRENCEGTDTVSVPF